MPLAVAAVVYIHRRWHNSSPNSESLHPTKSIATSRVTVDFRGCAVVDSDRAILTYNMLRAIVVTKTYKITFFSMEVHFDATS